MKRRAMIVALVAGLSFPVLAEDASTDKSRLAYAPRLSGIMIATQLSHFKLWYAGQVGNWRLAKYELDQIRAFVADALKFYPNTPSADMRVLEPMARDTDDAIEAKDGAKFLKAFGGLTSACNSCHEAAGFGFIQMREPRLSPIETSPFTDQKFGPK